MSNASPLFRRAKGQVGQPGNPYERFDLTQNPFPDRPSIVPESDDPRLNGSIYKPELRGQEQQRFEHLLIPTAAHPEIRPMVFLMDYATRRGRGIGKTAFLAYQRRQIMSDLGAKMSGGNYVLFAAHVLPPGEGRCRKSWQFARLMAETMNEQGILARALWRLRAFSGGVPDEVLDQVGDDAECTIGNDKWLAEQKVNVWFALTPAVEHMLKAAGVREEAAKALAEGGHSREQFDHLFLSRRTEHWWRNEGTKLVFDDLVFAFQAAGFSKGILLVDEVEKIVAHQNTAERRVFVEDVRYFFMDGPHQSARSSFYGLLLTIHPYVQELLASHWSAAGMDRFCALSGELEAENTIYFRPLETEAAVPLVLEYLDQSRPTARHRGQLTPFDRDAVIEALRLVRGVPGPMLTLLRHVMELAIQEDWPSIGAIEVRKVFQLEPPSEPEDKEEAETLPPAQVDLRGEE